MKSTTAWSTRRIGNALRYSSNGIRLTWAQEPAFRQEMIGFAVMAGVTLPLQLPALHGALLVALALIVLALELLNSGLEALVDKTCPEQHPLAGKAKDCGSAAVLMGILAWTIVWLTLAGPVVLQRLHAWVKG